MTTSKGLCRAACLLALSACVAAPAMAKESGFYLGATLGQSTYDVDNEPTGLFTTSTGVQTTDSDTSFSLDFGYRFNPYIGLEFSVADFGQVKVDELGSRMVTRTGPGITTPTRYSQGFLEADAGLEGASLSAVGSFPMGKLELFAKVGALYAKTRVNTGIYTNTADSASSCVTNCTWVTPGAGLSSESANTTEILYAAGAGYTFGDAFFVKLEYMMIPKAGDEELTGETDVNNISLGFQYRF